MDTSFKTDTGRFNFRVCGVIVRNNRLLVMQDGVAPYSYLPGGRVKMHETSEEAILREMQEEMNTILPVLRPLWLCQSFFSEDASSERFHEICIYYLLDGSALPDDSFIRSEKGRANRYEWVAFDKLKERYFYPEFIKREIFHLPDHLEILTERQ